MSKKASPTAIGIFIFAGLALLIAGLLTFTSSKLFTPKGKFIIYFDSNLSGLNEGAPVKYRGVTIGSVSQVMIRYNQATNDTAMPVIIELQEDLLRKRLVGPTIFESVTHLGQELRSELRGRLESESFVTGVLYVELEREANPPPAVFHQMKHVYIEIPSRPTQIQQLMKNLAKLDLAGLQEKVIGLITAADKVLADIKMDQITHDLTNLLVSANRVVTNPDLTNSFTNLKNALEQYRALGANLDGRVGPLASSVTNSLEKLDLALVQMRGAMENFRDTLAADSALRIQLSLALDQFTEAVQSVRAFADYLHDNPNALLTGRRPISDKTK